MHVIDTAVQTDVALGPLAERIAAATAALTALGRERAAAEASARERRARLAQDGEAALKAAERAPDAGRAEDAAPADPDEARTRRGAFVAQAALRRRRLLRAGHDAEMRALDLPRPAAPPAPPSAEALRELGRRRQALGRDLTVLRAGLDEVVERLDSDAALVGIRARPVAAAPGGDARGAIGRRLAQARDAMTVVAATADGLRDGAAWAACRLGRILLHHALVGLPHIALALMAAHVMAMPEVGLWTLVSAAATQALVVAVTAWRRFGLARRYRALRAVSAGIGRQLDRLERTSDEELHPGLVVDGRLGGDRRDDRPEREQVLRDRLEAALASVRRREQALIGRIDARHARDAAAAGDAVARREARAREALVRGRRRAAEDLRGRLAQADAAWAGAREELEGRWRDGFAALRALAEQAARDVALRHAPWSDPRWAAWTPPAEPVADLPLGEARTSLAALAEACGGPASARSEAGELRVPVVLAFPVRTPLYARVGPAARGAALALATATALRALAGSPPGRLRLTVVDPLGLGDSFAPLLPLADQEGGVMAGGVLTDATRIERGLELLVAHVGTVVQKFLRGRYATLDEYNREAGELQEPLHLVLVADFPAAFSERALEHLAVLQRSGSRCGIHLAVVADARQPAPRGFDAGWFARGGVVLREEEGALAVEHEALAGWAFAPEPPPPPALAARLVAGVASAAEGAARVEVPFGAVAPPADEVWSLSAARALRVPIGKRGADRLQWLELGRGTCQHVLVGGRTGSGKSTLFHVLVTSAALWYPPDELELHLIDFKKGVEFKTFASQRLPHARIIAIESDREFGLSVLRRLDLELTQRGERFRRAGVQDLAAHREAGDGKLPRVLLLIDEFQEFFTEDDAIARDAALLLDRLVRQGRAFGVHVVLGSQTLGGSYALARSSIGQMGVRIVLPCNEADAHLLLHEENDAARLLTRPGDAVYNDRAGLAEGNSPFQVCWLGEEEEAGLLAPLAARAADDGWRPPVGAVVFEGNAPARLADEPWLAAALAGAPAAADAAPARACIGQASSLDGATELAFPAAAGGNALLLGRDRESAAATCAALAIGLAARLPPGRLRLAALDGEDTAAPFAAVVRRLDAALPHRFPRWEARGAAELIGELAAVLERRRAGDDPDRSPILLVVSAIQRLRELRADEDPMAAGGSTAERFAALLADGPEYGLHALVCCDSLASLQRALGRRALREFDQRICFQMSAADSSELVDDDAASRLGLHTALLVAQGQGRREKFRPYALPDDELMARVAEALRARS